MSDVLNPSINISPSPAIYEEVVSFRTKASVRVLSTSIGYIVQVAQSSLYPPHVAVLQVALGPFASSFLASFEFLSLFPSTLVSAKLVSPYSLGISTLEFNIAADKVSPQSALMTAAAQGEGSIHATFGGQVYLDECTIQRTTKSASIWRFAPVQMALHHSPQLDRRLVLVCRVARCGSCW